LKVCPAEVRLAEVRPDEVRPDEVRPEEARPAEVRPAEVRLAEVRLAEVRPAEVRPDEVRPAEVRLAEVRHAEGRAYIRFFFSPLIPRFYTLFENRKMLFVCHTSLPAYGYIIGLASLSLSDALVYDMEDEH
jgi:hypothetical protein